MCKKKEEYKNNKKNGVFEQELDSSVEVDPLVNSLAKADSYTNSLLKKDVVKPTLAEVMKAIKNPSGIKALGEKYKLPADQVISSLDEAEQQTLIMVKIIGDINSEASGCYWKIEG